MPEFEESTWSARNLFRVPHAILIERSRSRRGPLNVSKKTRGWKCSPQGPSGGISCKHGLLRIPASSGEIYLPFGDFQRQRSKYSLDQFYIIVSYYMIWVKTRLLGHIVSGTPRTQFEIKAGNLYILEKVSWIILNDPKDSLRPPPLNKLVYYLCLSH